MPKESKMARTKLPYSGLLCSLVRLAILYDIALSIPLVGLSDCHQGQFGVFHSEIHHFSSSDNTASSNLEAFVDMVWSFMNCIYSGQAAGSRC